MPEILIVTTTFNRPSELERLRDSIDPKGVHWLVWNDGSEHGTYDLFIDSLPSWCTYYRSNVNRGKQGYWQTVDLIFKYIRTIDFRYCIFIPDDAKFAPGGMREAIKDLGDNNVLSLHNDQPERLKMNNWGRAPKDMGTHWEDGFIDMLFIARPEWFEKITWRVKKVNRDWDAHPKLGSGVGAQLTRKSYQKKEPIRIGKGNYIVRDLNNKSVMNEGR